MPNVPCRAMHNCATHFKDNNMSKVKPDGYYWIKHHSQRSKWEVAYLVDNVWYVTGDEEWFNFDEAFLVGSKIEEPKDQNRNN